MTKDELKKILISSGIENSDITDNDIETLVDIINQCQSPEEAYKKIGESFVGLSEEDLKAGTDLMLSKLEESEKDDIQDLSEEDLESIAGGSGAGDWFKDNWGYVVGAVALLGVCVVGGIAIGKLRNKAAMAKAEKAGFAEGHQQGKYEGTVVGFTAGLQARGMENMIPTFKGLGLKVGG